jgi:ACS family tartrate transporter-like MFS transporter
VVIGYLLNYIDRVNVSFAKLRMFADLGFDQNTAEAVYGLGAGIFFISYFLFEVPSNLIMERVGARLWMARIMISWGLISAAMMFVNNAFWFYALRFLLGAAEAGFAPGILLYLTYWLPVREQGKATAMFLTSTAIAGAIGAPLSTAIMKLEGSSLFGHSLHGWQWLFLLEGIPSVVFGVVLLLWLTDRPDHARWLSADERQWLVRHLEQERAKRRRPGHHSLLDGLTSGRVWYLNLIYCAMMFGFQAFNYWLATIVKEVTKLTDDFHVGLISSIPFVAAAIGMVLIGRHSDGTGERRWHVAICALVAAGGCLVCAATDSPYVAVAALTVGAVGLWGTLGPFWALPPGFLTGSAAAAGIAMINSIGNLGGGFLGPHTIGILKSRYQSYKPGLLVAAGALVVAAILTAAMRRAATAEPDKREV